MMEWLLTYLIHSTALLGLLLVADRRCIRAPGIREYAWKSAAFGAVLTATLQLAVLNAHPQTTPVTGRWELPTQLMPQPLSKLPATSAEPHDWRLMLLSLWGIAIIASASRVALLRRAVRQYVGVRDPANDATLTGHLNDLQQRAGIRGHIRLTTCERNISPMVFGRREICVPAKLIEQLDPFQQQSILAHEVAHIARRDPEWVVAFTALVIALPFQPLNWIASRRVRECAEYLCDSRAVTFVSTPVKLAQTLVEVARWLRPDVIELPYPAMAAHRGLLTHRVDRLLSGALDRTPRWTPVACMATIVAFMFVVPAITTAQNEAAKQESPAQDSARDAMAITNDVEVARKFVLELTQADYSRAARRLGSPLNGDYDATKLKALWEQTVARHGASRSYEVAGIQYQRIEDVELPVVVISVQMETSPVEVRMRFDGSSVVNLWITP